MKKQRRTKNTGAVKSKKKTIDGIGFSSLLEAYCYTRLKEEGLEFVYEPAPFRLLDSIRYSGRIYKNVPKTADLVDATGKIIRDITYTPDFLSEKHNFVIETKGFVPSQHTFHLRWKLFIHFLQETGHNYMLFLPRNQKQVDEAIKIIKDANSH